MKENRPETIIAVIILALCGLIIALIFALFFAIQNNENERIQFEEPNIKGPTRIEKPKHTKCGSNSLVPVFIDNWNFSHL